MNDPLPPRVLRRNAVLRYCGNISRSHLYRLLTRGEFPSPIKLGPQMVGWLVEDLDRWLAQRPQVAQR